MKLNIIVAIADVAQTGRNGKGTAIVFAMSNVDRNDCRSSNPDISAHPNVIAVHDVGTLPGARVFVAMELVDGVTLREWLEPPRSWREVLAVMRDECCVAARAHVSFQHARLRLASGHAGCRHFFSTRQNSGAGASIRLEMFLR